MRVMLHLTHDDIVEKIPYHVICEARYGSRWNTGKVRAEWLANFTETERQTATRLFRQAHLWALVKGAPNEISMTPDTYELWQKLGQFCARV